MSRSAFYDEDAEQAMLGAALMAPKVIADLHYLKPSHFYLETHQHIWAVILRMDTHGDKIDPITVADALEQAGKTPSQGRAYIHSLVSAAPSTVNAQAYADIVHRHHLVRELGALSADIGKMQSDNKSVPEILTHIGETLSRLEDGSVSDDLRPIADALHEYYEHLEMLASSDAKTVGIPTGFFGLDDLVSGLRDGAVILIAGRPGMGKTTFALALLEHASDVQRETAAAFFSLEQPDMELNSRMLAQYTKIPSSKLQHGDLTDDEWRIIHSATNTLSTRRIFIDDTPNITISEIRAKLRRLKRRQGLSIAFIDYLQLLNTDRHYDDRVRELSEISRGMKLLAKELNIPVVGLAQLNRQVEARTDKRPVLSDLRESGSLEQDADQVIMLYRDEYYHSDSPDIGMVEVLVRKNRHGPTGTCKLAFRADCGRFMNMSK